MELEETETKGGKRVARPKVEHRTTPRQWAYLILEEGQTEGGLSRVDDQEFHDFVAQRMERWRRSAFLMCLDWHIADDLVAVAVAKIYRHWREVRQADNPEAYAQRILSRTWLSDGG